MWRMKSIRLRATALESCEGQHPACVSAGMGEINVHGMLMTVCCPVSGRVHSPVSFYICAIVRLSSSMPAGLGIRSFILSDEQRAADEDNSRPRLGSMFMSPTGSRAHCWA